MNTQEIRELIDRQKVALFSSSLAAAKEAITSEPVPMLDETGQQRYWFIPFINAQKVVAFAIATLTGKVSMHGLLTPNADEKTDSSFFLTVPSLILNEIKVAYPHFEVLSQAFSYDEIPQRWSWRIKLKNQQQRITIFAGPTGWYEKKERKPGWEG